MMENILKTPHTLLFDWDGTLVDTMPCVLAGHNAVRRHFDLPEWGMTEYKANVAHRSSREMYPLLYKDKAEEAMTVLYDYIYAHHLEKLELLPGAANLIEMLAGTEIAQGIVSNKRHDILLREVEHLGWKDHFFSVVGAGYAPKDKPDPVIVETALAEGGITAALEDIWYVGDSVADMDTARNTGCPAILIGSGDNNALIEKYHPLGVFNSCHDLQSALASSIEQG